MGLTTPVIVALLGIAVPAGIAILHATFRIGGLTERVNSLDKWRDAYQASIRGDMHEISELLTGIQIEIKTMKALIEERTERRGESRTRP